jgi:hypothetical protein
MRLIKVDTSNQLVDSFTKPLQLPQFLSYREGFLLGKRGVELTPAGTHDSGGGAAARSKRLYIRSQCEDGPFAIGGVGIQTKRKYFWGMLLSACEKLLRMLFPNIWR